jgi:hypothetical protein
MTSSLFTRVEKLESRRCNDDQVLLLWIKPGEDVDAAVLAANKAGQFASGDLVMCAEWLGEEPTPKPQWLKRDGAYHGRFSEQEDHCITAALQKRIATVDELVATGEPADVASPMLRDPSEMSSVDLMHCALGVKT